MEDADKNPLKGKESVSKMTRDFMIASRKEKKIKKTQQRHLRMGLKNYGNCSKRGFS
jgi:hypothetical protein